MVFNGFGSGRCAFGSVASVFLGTIERLVGAFDQRAGVIVFAVRGHAHAHGDTAGLGVLELPDCGVQACSNLQRALLVGIRLQDQKLFTAPTDRPVGFTQGLLHRLADRLQYFVADGVTVLIVASLEMIDIDHDHAPALVVAPGQFHLLL